MTVPSGVGKRVKRTAAQRGGMSPVAPTPPPVPERTAHPYLTHDMIHGIPAAARATLRDAAGPAARAADGMADRSFLAFTGCGTAFFAAVLGQRLSAAGLDGRVRSEALPALEISAYGRGVDRHAGVVGVSHSGITKTTVDALRSARARGARTVGITHFADRPISSASDATIVVGDGPDRSRCHTKCFVTGALGSAAVGLEWGAAHARLPRKDVEERMAALRELPSIQERVLRSQERICEELAESHLGRRSTYLAGSGPDEPIALEAALKLKETSFIGAEAMETEQFLHGPWQPLDSDSLVFVLIPGGPARGRSVDLLHAARAVGAHAVALATEGDGEVEKSGAEAVWLPAVDEFLSPLVNIIPLYLYAYYASVKRGNNPDVLRYLEPRYWAAREIIFPPGTH